jgi:molybdopterin molybdotransferase
MVVTTGGVSVGDEDHMPRLFSELGGDMSVMKVAIKPGKPVTFGRLDKAIFIGLPGNPVSAFVTWTIIGARILEKCAGLERRQGGRLLVRVSAPITRQPGRTEFRPARFTGNAHDGGQQVELLDATFSGRVALLSLADGLAIIPADKSDVASGETLEFIPF